MHCPNNKNGPIKSLVYRALRMSTFIYKGIFATQSNSFIYLLTYLILERGDGRERNINMRNVNQLHPVHTPTWAEPTTQARALMGN